MSMLTSAGRPLTLPWATAFSWCLSWSSSSSSLIRWTRLSRSHTSLRRRLSFSPSSHSSLPVLVAGVSWSEVCWCSDQEIISAGGNQYWFGLRKPPCQFLFSVCPCLQLFGNVSYSLYTHNNNNRETNRMTDIDLSLDIFPSKTKLLWSNQSMISLIFPQIRRTRRKLSRP